VASVLERLRAELAREADPGRRYELQQQIDSLLADRPAPEGQEWVHNEAGEPELVRADTGEGKPWTPADRAAEEQRQAAEWERLQSSIFFRGPSPDEQREMEQLARGVYPQRSVNHVKPLKRATPEMRRAVAARRDPGVRRKPTRDGRTARPRARRSPRATRAGPRDAEDDPADRPAAALAVATAAAGVVAFTRSRRDAVVLARVVMRAAQTYEGPRYG
jgi:hypothetical protein